MIKGIYNRIHGDKAIWLVVLFLGLLSVLAVYSSIVTLAYKHHEGNTLYYLVRHSMFLAIGLFIIYFVHKVKYIYFSRVSQLALYISIPLLLVTLLFGANINEASRWLVIPVINQTFQTSDFAKLALIMYVARMLVIKQNKITDFKEAFLPIVIPVIIICGLIVRSNFSTAAALFISSLMLMFFGKIKIKHLAGLVAVGLICITIVLLIGKVAPSVFPRAQTWINRVENFGNNNDADANYQVEQSKIAIATGGIAGKGPGKSTQRNFLPHPYSDFIYAIIIEEYGIIGGFAVVFLYLILLFRAIKIAISCEKLFGSLLVLGISFSLVFQAMINMAVAVNIIPVTGQPLPMISMGGTSIWFTCIAIGIILSVSVETEKTKVNTMPAHATA